MINHQDFNHKGNFVHYMLSIRTSLVKFEWNSVLFLMIRGFNMAHHDIKSIYLTTTNENILCNTIEYFECQIS